MPNSLLKPQTGRPSDGFDGAVRNQVFLGIDLLCGTLPRSVADVNVISVRLCASGDAAMLTSACGHSLSTTTVGACAVHCAGQHAVLLNTACIPQHIHHQLKPAGVDEQHVQKGLSIENLGRKHEDVSHNVQDSMLWC